MDSGYEWHDGIKNAKLVEKSTGKIVATIFKGGYASSIWSFLSEDYISKEAAQRAAEKSKGAAP